MRGRNVYCPGEQGVSKEYRQNYDEIRWDKDEEDEPRVETDDDKGRD